MLRLNHWDGWFYFHFLENFLEVKPILSAFNIKSIWNPKLYLQNQ